MKEKIFICVFICISSISNAQVTEIKDTIKGNVSSFKETWYDAKTTKKGFQKGKYLHDDEYLKNENNVFVKKTIFPLEKYEIPQNEFNNKNQILKSVKYSEDGNIINKTLYIYKNDTLVEENFYLTSDTITSKKTFEYKDNKKYKTIEYYFDKDENKLVKNSVTTYLYDNKNGTITKNIDYEYQDDWIYLYKYNNKHFLIELYFAEYKKNEKPNLKIIKKIIYTSDDGTNWLTAYFIDEFDKVNSTKPSKIYFLERQFNYEK
ncbi:hypothetical protein CWI39_2849p0020 [Hamiltosporidium magnivora]|uniref:Uncharacterized protein n=1 Tax=Hamiltosporidium magnivora TaxID=148818 RepID=A0A4Q9KSX9_9MICR|nr:hypothetical protein CWI39_2849p0020 [Hamiltosporidium magnivora]